MKQLLPHKEDTAISRVVLLSDGRANVGVTDPNRLFRNVLKHQRKASPHPLMAWEKDSMKT